MKCKQCGRILHYPDTQFGTCYECGRDIALRALAKRKRA